MRRSLYGPRHAPALWEAYAAAQLQSLGCVWCRPNACKFAHPLSVLRSIVHGDGVFFIGTAQGVVLARRELEKTVVLNLVGEVASGRKRARREPSARSSVTGRTAMLARPTLGARRSSKR